MKILSNQSGSVIVFVTLMIVLLMIMVGMGLDTGQLVYTRNMGQSAVDSAALSAVSGLPSRDAAQVTARAAEFNSTNDYTGSSKNVIAGANVSYVKYDHASSSITNYNEPIATANGVRVALEGGTAMKTPAFLTPLMNLFGIGTSGVQNVNVSAVATIATRPAIPIALWSNVCPATNGTVAQNVEIKFQHPSKTGDGENACWTTFLDCSSGASDIKALFQVAQNCSGSPIDGRIAINTPICQNRGQVNSVLFEAESFFTSFPEYPERWWLIPVIGGGGNCDPTNPSNITNWAKIKPKGFVTKGDPKFIKADVVCGPNLINEDLESGLCFHHRLVREPGKGY
jgi:Putative Flp pilus-assembly TadE/G-like